MVGEQRQFGEDYASETLLGITVLSRPRVEATFSWAQVKGKCTYETVLCSLSNAQCKKDKSTAHANNSATKVNNVTNPLATNPRGAAAGTGKKVSVLAGGSDCGGGGGGSGSGGEFVAPATVMLDAGVMPSAWGIVNVTTDEPFCPQPTQLCVSVVKGTTAGAVAVAGPYVKTMPDVTTTSVAGLVAHTVVNVTVRVMVITPVPVGVPSAGAGDGSDTLPPPFKLR